MTQADWTKTFVDFVASTLGFMIALLVNTLVGWRKEKKTYRLMLQAIAAEAESNQAILQESFLPYYEAGIVIREFNLHAVTDYLSDQVFVKNADQSIVTLLGAYLRTLHLANAYRQKAEHFLLNPKGKETKDWLLGVRFSWKFNLEQCAALIEKVSAVSLAP